MKSRVKKQQHSTNKSEQKGNPLEIVNLQQLLTETTNPLAFRIEPFLEDDGSLAIAGPSGHCKTWMALHPAIALANGHPFLGTFATIQSRVLYLDAENNRTRIQERVRRLCGTPSLIETPNLAFVFDACSRIDTPKGYRALADIITSFGPDVVMFDSLDRFHGADENSANEMSKVFAWLRKLQRTGSFSVVLIDQTRKLGAKETNASSEVVRGSNVKTAWVDNQLLINRIHPGLVTVTHSKSRNASPVDKFDVRLEISDNRASLSCAKSENVEPAAEDRILMAARSLAKESRDGGFVIGDLCKATGFGAGPVTRVVKTL